MNSTLRTLVSEYGTETIIARVLEQLKLAALSDDEEVKATVRELLEASACDTEYLYLLCEYTNLMTYVSETAEVTDGPWKDQKSKAGLRTLKPVK